MCEALAFAHDQKVVHRDVKTANTMWTRDKKAKIMDFGLAKVIEEVRNHTTLVSGTPYYMSPEQTLGRNVDHRTDIYSLGATLYELLTLEPPFPGQRRDQIIAQIIGKEPKSARRHNKRVPVDLETICLKAMEKDPDRRSTRLKFSPSVTVSAFRSPRIVTLSSLTEISMFSGAIWGSSAVTTSSFSVSERSMETASAACISE